MRIVYFPYSFDIQKLMNILATVKSQHPMNPLNPLNILNVFKRLEKRHFVDAALILAISVIIVVYKMVGIMMK
jgi:hypothetical protein